MITRERRDTFDDAGAGDQVIRWIRMEARSCAGARDFQADSNDRQLAQGI
jgi:hypothetical protein